MAAVKPLVIVAGQIQQLQAGDTLDAVVTEVDIIAMTNENAGAIVIGTPVYVSSVDNVDKAQANASGTKDVVGLVKDTSIASAASGSIQTDGFLTATTTEWDAVTGDSGGLTYNAEYYLDPSTAGMLTTTPPSTGGQYIAPIGTALNTTDLEISIEPTILL